MATRREQRQKQRKRQQGRRKQQRRKNNWVLPSAIVAFVLVIAVGGIFIWKKIQIKMTPKVTLTDYVALLGEGKYEEMYAFLSETAKNNISQEDFVARNKNIYEGIEAANFNVVINGEPEYSDGKKTAVLSYSTTMDSCAGEIAFDNKMTLVLEEREYRMNWDSTLIFPALKDAYKVQINTETAKRGSILDRNGAVLAGQGMVSEVGIVPGKLGEKKEESIQKISEILNISTESIHEKLNASYVQEDTFVPLREISQSDTETEEKLLEISGILINDKEERVYPLGAAAGHLTGYVQTVTAEDLENLAGQGYHANSVIGRAGLERIFEEELRPIDGSTIDIVDADGTRIETVAYQPAQNGKDVRVTIDAALQRTAYEQFASDTAAAVAMNPKTGEVLALVSAPGYDPNEFILGMSDKRWEELNGDENQPLLNRFLTSWVPGSTFKAITAAIGVDTGKIDPSANIGYVGLKWQKDGSWGDYYVTTLTDYGEEVTLENALVYSDNIYFARAALDIGADTFVEKLKTMGFDEEIPFELELTQSTYDTDGVIDSEIQLADSGYGQGQLLVNPVHMLSIYSLFVNGGDMIAPTLVFEENAAAAVWKEQVVSAETAALVKNDLIQVIENPSGTGASAKIEGVTMLGKTGTAEIKESQDDTEGVERGWFLCETDEGEADPIAVVGMVENVKDKGGSSYVTVKVREIAAGWVSGN